MIEALLSPTAEPNFMQTSVSPLMIFVAFVGVLAVVLSIVSFLWLRRAKISMPLVGIAVAPAALMLILFYSLAWHMHSNFGSWPSSIGNTGFSSSLNTHAAVARIYFAILFLVSVYVWPLGIVICLGFRKTVFYFGVYGFACLVCFGAMLIAPSAFLYWWWD
ncbi:MAG: hypothetical protein ACK4UN_06855 [Limisphaerales bacterium]